MSSADIITLNCPACGKLLKVKAEMAGQRLACPKEGCGAAIDVPGTAIKPGLGLKAQLMTAVGLVFAIIAAVLTIRELHLEAGWIVSMVLVAAVVVAEFLTGYFKAAILILFTLVGLSTPALFFILERKQDQREWAFYVGAVLFFGLASYLIFRTYSIWSQFEFSKTEKHEINLASIVVWFALIVSSVAFSWVTYYKFLTPLKGDAQVEIASVQSGDGKNDIQSIKVKERDRGTFKLKWSAPGGSPQTTKPITYKEKAGDIEKALKEVRGMPAIKVNQDKEGDPFLVEFLDQKKYETMTALGEEILVRRLVFTLFFVVVGVVCSVLGRNSVLPFLGATGLTYMAAGVVKALAYDITHLEGFLRIGVFAGCGAVLLLGGLLMMKKGPRPEAAAAGSSAFIED